MWIYQRALSLTSRRITLVRRGYTFSIDHKGVLLSKPTADMERVLRADPAWRFVSVDNPPSRFEEAPAVLWIDAESTTDSTPSEATDSTPAETTDSTPTEPTPVKRKRGRPAKAKE